MDSQKQNYIRQVCFPFLFFSQNSTVLIHSTNSLFFSLSIKKLTLIDPSSLPLTTTVKTGCTFKHVIGAEWPASVSAQGNRGSIRRDTPPPPPFVVLPELSPVSYTHLTLPTNDLV